MLSDLALMTLSLNENFIQGKFWMNEREFLWNYRTYFPQIKHLQKYYIMHVSLCMYITYRTMH